MKKKLIGKISWNTILIFVLFLACIAEFAYLISSQKTTAYDDAKKAAVTRAGHTAMSISKLRKYYTNNIVEAVKGHTSMKISQDYKNSKFDSTGAIPLPATVAIEYATAISDSNTEARLVSEFPFPWRKDRKYTDFDKKAETLFKTSSETEYYEIDDINKYIYYAVPDKMSSPTCINCHNTHPDSPKKDWVLGDVRGIITISTPIKTSESSQNSAIILILITIGLLGLIVYSGYIRTNKSIRNISDAIAFLSRGKLLKSEIPVKDKNLVPVASKVGELSGYLNDASSFAEKIGKGDFTAHFSDITEDDNLKNSLVQMRNSLLQADEEDKKRNWATEGLAKFGEILRTNTDNLEELSNEIISGLAKYLNANQGSLFIVVDGKEAKPFLELQACYAWNKKKYIQKRIESGEGLVGQAWQENDTIYLTDVPGNYVKITSGLGDSNPKSILIVPLKVNEVTYGIIELASFQEFQKHEIDFLQKLGESIASTISSVKINARTKVLLEESQQQSEELKAQEEEMRQNMEEMQATQEEMHRKEKELQNLIAQAEGKEEKLKQIVEQIQLQKNESLDIFNIIDVAGRNRFFSQRLAFYAERIGNGDENIKEDTRKVIEMLDSNLKALKEGGVAIGTPYHLPATTDKNILSAIEQTESVWLNYKTIIQSILNEPLFIKGVKNPIVMNAIDELPKISEAALSSCNKLTICYINMQKERQHLQEEEVRKIIEQSEKKTE